MSYLDLESLDPSISLRENVALELAALYERIYRCTGTRPLSTEHEVEQPDWTIVEHNSFARLDPRSLGEPIPDDPS